MYLVHCKCAQGCTWICDLCILTTYTPLTAIRQTKPLQKQQQFPDLYAPVPILSLQWRHNERNGVSNHQHHDCLLNRYSRRRSTKTSKLRVTILCAGNSPVTGEFPAQRTSNAENVSTCLNSVDTQAPCGINFQRITLIYHIFTHNLWLPKW